MKKFYLIFHFLFAFALYSQETSTVSKIEQINTYNGGNLVETIFDNDQNIISVGSSNGPFAINNTNITSQGLKDLYVLKTNKSTGENIWLKTLSAGLEGYIEPTNISVDKENNFYVTASFFGQIVIGNNVYNDDPTTGVRFIILKFDSNGNILWGKTYNSLYASILVNPVNQIAIKNNNIFLLVNPNSVIKIDKNSGELLSEYSFTNYQIKSLISDEENIYAACQNFLTPINILDLAVVSNANFILKLDDNLLALNVIQVKNTTNNIQNLFFKSMLTTNDSVYALYYKTNNVQYILENPSGNMIEENKMSNSSANNYYMLFKLNDDLTSASWFNTNALGSNTSNNYGLFQNKNGNVSIYFPQNSGNVNYGSMVHNFSSSGILNIKTNGDLIDNNLFDASYAYYKNFDYAFDSSNEYFVKTSNFNSGFEQFSNIFKKNEADKFTNQSSINVNNAPGYFKMTDFYKITPDGHSFFTLDAISGSKYINYFGNNIDIPIQNTTVISKLSKNGQENWNSLMVGNNIIFVSNFGKFIDVNSLNQTIIAQNCWTGPNCRFIQSDKSTVQLLNSKLHLIKLNDVGKIAWRKEFSFINNVTTVSKMSTFYDALGNIFLVAAVSGKFIYDNSTTITPPTNISDGILIMKVDPLGNYLYHKIFDYTRYSNAFLEFDNQNNPFLFLTVTDFQRNLQFDNISLEQTNSYIKLIMLKFDDRGNVTFGKNLSPAVSNDNYYDQLLDVKKHNDDFIIYSWTNNQKNLLGQDISSPYNTENYTQNYNLISKISSTGNPIWSEPIFYSDGIIINNLNKNFLEVNEQGDIYILDAWTGIGNYKGNVVNNNYSNKLSLLKIDNSANFKFFKSLGNVSDGFNISLSNENKITLSTITLEKNLDGKVVNRLGGQNFVIAQLDEEVLSTQENKKHTLEIYPNPTSDFININTKEKIYNIEIYEAGGRKVITEINSNNQIDVRKLIKGIYYIRVITAQKNLTSKFIKN